MIYYNDKIAYIKEPMHFNLETDKEILQYAMAGMLYMPGALRDLDKKIINFGMEYGQSISICLEDAVADSMLEEAEINTINALQTIEKNIATGLIDRNTIPLIFIRIRNPKHLKEFISKIGIDTLGIVAGFNLPKIDTDNIYEYDEFIPAFEEEFTSIHGRPCYVMPILESEKIISKVSRMDELIQVDNVLKKWPVLNVRVGITDFSNVYGVRRRMENSVYDIRVISECLTDIINVFAKNYVCSAGIYEYYESPNGEGADSVQYLLKEIDLDMVNGFFGKSCIHPSQIKHVLNKCIVRNDDYQDAVAILGMKDNNQAVVASTSNKMNEYKTHYVWATKVIAQSNVYGVSE